MDAMEGLDNVSWTDFSINNLYYTNILKAMTTVGLRYNL